MYLILFSAHKNINYKTNTRLFTPQDTTATYSNYSKSGEEQEDGQTLSEGFEWLQEAPKSWFRAQVENGLQRGKPGWMVGGHQSVAKGVGERVEQPEGLYLGCQPRYSCEKRLPG